MIAPRCRAVLVREDAVIRCTEPEASRSRRCWHSGFDGCRRVVWSDRSEGAASLVPPGTLNRRRLADLMAGTVRT